MYLRRTNARDSSPALSVSFAMTPPSHNTLLFRQTFEACVSSHVGQPSESAVPVPSGPCLICSTSMTALYSHSTTVPPTNLFRTSVVDRPARISIAASSVHDQSRRTTNFGAVLQSHHALSIPLHVATPSSSPQVLHFRNKHRESTLSLYCVCPSAACMFSQAVAPVHHFFIHSDATARQHVFTVLKPHSHAP